MTNPPVVMRRKQAPIPSAANFQNCSKEQMKRFEMRCPCNQTGALMTGTSAHSPATPAVFVDATAAISIDTCVCIRVSARLPAMNATISVRDATILPYTSANTRVSFHSPATNALIGAKKTAL